jgi:hypothetical protein
MASPALALPALSAFFSVATCDTGCGRKPQNQYLIRLLAPIDNGKSLLLLLINNAPVRRDMKTARDMPIFPSYRIWLFLANESQAHNPGTPTKLVTEWPENLLWQLNWPAEDSAEVVIPQRLFF